MADEKPKTVTGALREGDIREARAKAEAAEARAELLERHISKSRRRDTGILTAASARTWGKWLSIALGPPAGTAIFLWTLVAQPQIDAAHELNQACVASQETVVAQMVESHQSALEDVRRDGRSQVDDVKDICGLWNSRTSQVDD